jgi:hypothetical protein
MRTRYLAALLALASCATEQATLTTPQQLFTQATDTPAALVPLAAGGKFKFKGPVSIVVQAGTGNVATPTVTGTDKTGQHAQAVSTGANSPVTASSKKGGVPWWVFVGIGGLSIAAWQWLKPNLTARI